ncbi:MAG: ABC transporter ATP-binding protein [Phycisphaerales bacterium]|nr:ABC transporter ATP-binding protein [Phycisphaerales bacterium]
MPDPTTIPEPRSERAAAHPAAPSTLVSLRDVHKRFGRQRVLAGLDLDVPEGRCTVILGPSGCGKSVTLKHISGLLAPDAGEVWFDGVRVDRYSERQWREVRLQIGFVFQMSALFDSMSVADNLAFPMIEHTRMPRAQRNERIDEALSVVDLEGVREKLPSELSGGQRKRVALARAIVLKPRLMLYDEPTTGLDPVRADGIDQLVRKLQRTLGVTSIVVTHDLSSAEKVGDEIVMLLDGKAAARGSLAQLKRSTDPRVAHFLAGRYHREDDLPEALGGAAGDQD